MLQVLKQLSQEYYAIKLNTDSFAYSLQAWEDHSHFIDPCCLLLGLDSLVVDEHLLSWKHKRLIKDIATEYYQWSVSVDGRAFPHDVINHCNWLN